jgi:hypothetical protein
LRGTKVSREGRSIVAPDRNREQRWAGTGSGSMAIALLGAGRWTAVESEWAGKRIVL